MRGKKKVWIQTPNIRLSQFLKWSQEAESGGEAKQLIIAGRVRVNGQVERRRNRQLVPGDTVQVEDGPLLVVAAGGGEENPWCD